MRGRSPAVLFFAVVVLAAMVVPAVAATGRVELPNSQPSFARSSRPVSSTAPDERIDLAVWLGFNDPAAAAALAHRISDPASPDHGKFLSTSDAIARFSPTLEQAEAVAEWLRSQELDVSAMPASRLFVPATGSAAQVEKAFGISLDEYRAGGTTVRAPSSAPSVPADLGIRGVAGLTGLEAGPSKTPPPAPAVFRVGKPCSQYWSQKMAVRKPKAYGQIQPFAVCGYTPSQMQSAYGVDEVISDGTDGSGVTVAIIDAFASPDIQADLDQYSSLHGLPQLTISQIVDPLNDAPLPHQQGWWGEETLDVEAVHAMAPGASILYRGAAGGGAGSILFALEDVVGNHRADEVTNSYGYRGEQRLPASDMGAYNDVFELAVLTGVGVYFSSGDAGDESGTQDGYPTADFPASSPWVTAVGGTSLGVGALGDRVLETGWGTYWSGLYSKGWSPKPPGIFWYGGGGGTSRVYAQPWYQAGVVPGDLAGRWGGTARVVPDIAMDGDPNTGFLVGETQSFPDGSVGYDEYRIGGTSLSSPLFAGVMALADDYWNTPHGFVNPWLYELGGDPAINDIVDPGATVAVVRADYLNGYDNSAGKAFSLRTMNMDTSLDVKPGYDDVTGMGTPNGWSFVLALDPCMC